MKVLAYAARALRREFRHGELRTLAAALILAVAALAAVATLGERVERAILANAAELIGGDLGVAARHTLPAEFAAEAARLGLRTNTNAEFPSVVFSGDKSQLVQILASDDAYPLRGTLIVRGSKGVERMTQAPPAGKAFADHAVLAALALRVGDTLQLAGRSLRIDGEIVRQPDGGQLFALAPRLIIALDDARNAGLLGAGSRARHRLMLAGDVDTLAQFTTWAKPRLDNAELVTVAEAQQNLRTAFDRGSAFLRLAALLSALLSGIAVTLAAQRFARRKTDEVALLRTLGLDGGRVLGVLATTLLLLAVPACLLGAGLGLILQEGVLHYARALLPSTSATLSLWPSIAAITVGFTVLIGFALPPLARLRDVPPVRVFQRAAGMRPRRFDLLYLLPPLVAFTLILSQSGDAAIASALGASLAGVALTALLTGLILIFALRRLGRRLTGALRFGLATLARRRTLSLIQITALALGFTAWLLLSVVGPSLLAAWRADLPSDTPNHFLLNLQTEQRIDVESRLDALGARNLNLMPLAVGKLIAINGHAPRAEDFNDRRANTAINREIRLSWSATLPAANKLIAGRWFVPDTMQPQLSVETLWVDMFGLKLGDIVTLSIGEQRIRANVTSIREVDWSSFRVNFFLLLDPVSAGRLPHSLLASFYLPPRNTAALGTLVRDHPNLSLIDIDALLDRVREIIDRVGMAVSWVLSFSLAAGLLVLIAALNVSAEERRFEAALLRTLGATHRQLATAVLGEFGLLGGIAGTIAAIGAATAGISLGHGVFKIAWSPPLGELALNVASAVALVTLAGWFGTRAIARTSPTLVLRREL